MPTFVITSPHEIDGAYAVTNDLRQVALLDHPDAGPGEPDAYCEVGEVCNGTLPIGSWVFEPADGQGDSVCVPCALTYCTAIVRL